MEPSLSSQDMAGQQEKEKEKEQSTNSPYTSKLNSVSAIEVSTTESQTATDDETLHEELNPSKEGQIVISDWSQTGRGSHVEFSYAETVPLKQGESAQYSTPHC
jgi:hypothetical protein